MDVENILLVTTPFFESGFNGSAWSLAADFEYDQYYFDISPISQSRSFEEELESAVAELLKRYPRLGIIDDGSLESKLMKALAPTATVISKDQLPEPNLDFINLCQESYLLDDPEMIAGLYAGYRYKNPLLFPRWQARILNVNFSRSQNRTLGQPYYVFVENEKFHRLRVAQAELGIRMSWNILLSTPSLFRSYFFHLDIRNWLDQEGHRAPHNYEAERRVFLTTLRKWEINHQDVHRTPWNLGQWSHQLKQKFPPQQAAFPLHLFFEKRFQAPCPYNGAERGLYGS